MFSFNVAPKDAIAVLRKKRLLTRFHYYEVQRQAHHKVFTVAKEMKTRLLGDIRDSLVNAMEKGIGFDEWHKNIKTTLIKAKWYGVKTVTDPLTGETKTINIGSRRLRNMFETNMRVSYAIQREATANKIEGLDYRRYVCMLLPNSREAHKKMHNMVLHKNDPWWNVNTPPNGWNCHCKKMAISDVEAEMRGLKISDSPNENIASKDWSYDPSNPNQGWDNKSTPPIERQPDYKSQNRPEDLSEVSEGRLAAPDLLPEGHSYDEALEIMSKAILGDQKERIVDTRGGKVLITKKLLGHTVEKRTDKRERFANYVIPTLTDPYEIYLTKYADGSRRMQYIGLFSDKEGKKTTFLTITLMRDGNILWNAIPARKKYINQARKGWLIYGK
jgi:hypothetical protein